MFVIFIHLWLDLQFEFVQKIFLFLRNFSCQRFTHIQSCCQDCNLDSYTTYVVCVSFLCMSGWTYSLKSISNDRFFVFQKHFFGIFYSHSNFLFGFQPKFLHHLCCMCVIFIHLWLYLQFEVYSERRIFRFLRNLSRQFFIHIQSFCKYYNLDSHTTFYA